MNLSNNKDNDNQANKDKIKECLQNQLTECVSQLDEYRSKHLATDIQDILNEIMNQKFCLKSTFIKQAYELLWKKLKPKIIKRFENILDKNLMQTTTIIQEFQNIKNLCEEITNINYAKEIYKETVSDLVDDTLNHNIKNLGKNIIPPSGENKSTNISTSIDGGIQFQKDKVFVQVWDKQKAAQEIVNNIIGKFNENYEEKQIQKQCTDLIVDNVKEKCEKFQIPIDKQDLSKITIKEDYEIPQELKQVFEKTNYIQQPQDSDQNIEIPKADLDKEIQLQQLFDKQYESTLKKQLFHIFVWHDQHVYNEENQLYQQILGQQGFNLKTFNVLQDAVNYIKSSKDELILITCGSQGEPFIKLVHNQNNVIKIYVFTMKIEHKQWALNYSKVKDVYIDFFSLLKELKQIDKELSEKNKCESVLKEKNICCLSYEDFQKNLVNSSNLLKKNMDEDSQFFSEKSYDYIFKLSLEDCFKSLAGHYQNSGNIKSLIQEKASHFSNKQFSLMIKDYTKEDFFYKRMNQILRENNKNQDLMIACKLASEMAHAMKQLENQQFSGTCYRGLSLPSKEANYLAKFENQIMAFRAFTSTSKNINVANGFGQSFGNDFIGIVLEIETSANERDGLAPIRILDSVCNNEEEILFGPMSFFKITQLQKSNETKQWRFYLKHISTYLSANELLYACIL